jgi:DNA-binding protein H-NS
VELVKITANIAYLKVRNDHLPGSPIRAGARDDGNSGREMAIKYRDSATGDTWTGRGGVARWLKVKHDAGEDIEKYRA